MIQFNKDTATTIAPSMGLYTIKIGTNNRIDKIDLTPKYKKPLDYIPISQRRG